MEKEIICIVCARGCRSLVCEDDEGVKVRGKLCKNGQAYVKGEYRDPRRVLSTTIAVEGKSCARLAVRTRGPIPRDSLVDCVRYLRSLKAIPPLAIGDVVVKNILGTGEDIVACSPLS
jgi:CxxC motif-containing protein